ncbi:hypothetical protein DFJ67_6848 [Asanoa ferruginea]|uniref:Outer membrane repeat protein n=1 Tax=Asanoa ferruginea TaxID=53367 RepID=A0A3E0A395_9ACTN|nr:hypothetical protein [Asanoa ferruginea]REG00791.1 hypothetical protein DFJ67_6848 [Asanoa ferruginea]GIF47334.1 hypothetical protein Afe04nite_18730 [Asanoa ferruginea]
MYVRHLLAATVVLGSVALAQPAAASARAFVPCNAAALQTAVVAANTAGGGTLDLSPACTYTLTTPAVGDNGLAVITTPIRINGNLATITRATSAADFRFFEVGGTGNLTLNAVKLSNGRAINGGAIQVSTAGARLTLVGSTVTGNTATAVGGGGILNFGTAEINGSTLRNNTGFLGGAFNSQANSTTTFKNSTVSGNHGVVGGGLGILGTVTLNGTRIASNDATGSGAFGGGVANGGTLTVTGGLTHDNVANGANAHGGGLYNQGTLKVTSNVLSGNAATGTNARGGAIYIEGGGSTLEKLTILANRATGTDATGGAIFRQSGAVLYAGNTLAGNKPNNCGNPSTVAGCA